MAPHLKTIGLAAWALAHPALYGYHLASLNGVQDVAVCAPTQAGLLAVSVGGGGGGKAGSGRGREASAEWGWHVATATAEQGGWGLHECLSVDDAQFGLAVTIITLGGLIGSLSAETLIRRFGRNWALRAAQLGMLLGAVGVGVANDIWLLAAGRFTIGLASGLIMVSIPPFLSTLSSSPAVSKMLGSMHQICIGLGMIIAQSLSLIPALEKRETGAWRMELAVAAAIALVIGVAGLALGLDANADAGADADARAHGIEGPVADAHQRGDGASTPAPPTRGAGIRAAANAGTAAEAGEAGERQPLLNRSSSRSRPRSGQDERRGVKERQMGIREAFAGHTRTGATVVVVALCAQQITGISPVMFFSSKILKSTFGGESKLVALSMMAVGIPFNFMPGILKVESKKALLLSAAGTALFSLLLAIGINAQHQLLSGVSVIGFVVSFSFGLAPVPWVVLSEVLPAEARTAVGSVGVALNWGTNLALGSTFIPLQSRLAGASTANASGPEPEAEVGEGNVFYVYAALSALAFGALWASFRAYERDHDARKDVGPDK